ncbi:MAG: alpha/beta hydrolase [Caldilinea sp. CFX5]|nr:alpha/beta hydrolase [Caldilinea sp. CFX5]
MVILAVALLFIGFLVWAGRPAMATTEALDALTTDEKVFVTTTPWLVFTPVTPTATTGLIFYPGGLVDPRAYAPAARAIAAEGYLVAIVPMPFNLAVFAPNRGLDVMAAYPTIEQWAIGGHSMGGAMAANFAATQDEAVSSLILWASYPTSNNSLARRENLQVTSIYGTNDGLSTIAKIEESRALLPPDSTFVAIEGGNHAQFGWYGAQDGDNPAAIPHETQEAQVITATLAALAAVQQ